MACGHAGAQTPSSKLMSLLAAEEYVPLGFDLAQLGPGIPEQLISIASESAVDPAYRARALALLQFYPGNVDVQNYLNRFLAQEDQSSTLMRPALIALAKVSRGNAIQGLSRHLSSEDVLIRGGAADALFLTGDPAATAILRTHASVEKEVFLRKHMEDMITKQTENADKTVTTPFKMQH
ncbi:MAG: HEAT repeat domain-containing protein [Nitrospirota bacterium]